MWDYDKIIWGYLSSVYPDNSPKEVHFLPSADDLIGEFSKEDRRSFSSVCCEWREKTAPLIGHPVVQCEIWSYLHLSRPEMTLWGRWGERRSMFFVRLDVFSPEKSQQFVPAMRMRSDHGGHFFFLTYSRNWKYFSTSLWLYSNFSQSLWSSASWHSKLDNYIIIIRLAQICNCFLLGSTHIHAMEEKKIEIGIIFSVCIHNSTCSHKLPCCDWSFRSRSSSVFRQYHSYV